MLLLSSSLSSLLLLLFVVVVGGGVVVGVGGVGVVVVVVVGVVVGGGGGGCVMLFLVFWLSDGDVPVIGRVSGVTQGPSLLCQDVSQQIDCPRLCDTHAKGRVAIIEREPFVQGPVNLWFKYVEIPLWGRLVAAYTLPGGYEGKKKKFD